MRRALCGAFALAACTAHAQVGEVVDSRGASIVERTGQAPRLLGAGEPIGERDVIRVSRDGHTIVRFRDDTRVALRPNTVFRVDEYRETAPESMVMGLLRGGMRVVTGLLPRKNPSAVSFRTVTATIGIRGTEFDARLCEDDCAREGTAGQTGSVSSAGSNTTAATPAAATTGVADTTQSLPAAPARSEATPDATSGEPGLYVWVRDGAVEVRTAAQTVQVGAGNAALATADRLALLDAVPDFMRRDTTPLPTVAPTAPVPDAFRAPDGSTIGMCRVR